MERVNNLISKLDSGFPWVRKRALKNLVEVGQPAVKEIIVTLDTPHAPIGFQAINTKTQGMSVLDESLRVGKRWYLLIDALVQIGKSALDELENALHHPNPNVCVSAMLAIGRIGHPSAVDLLLPYLDSNESYEREWAIVALGHTHSSRVYEIIVAALDNKTVDQDSTTKALGELGDVRALPRLEKIASSYEKLDGRYGFEKRTVVNEAIRSIQKENEQ